MVASRESAAAFVEAYGRMWETWDIPAFVDLFSEDVVYVAHPTEETVVGRAELEAYLRKEAADQGDVTVRMGTPIVEGDRVAAEFWVEADRAGSDATITGCLIARIAAGGRCSLFREYWFDEPGRTGPYDEWGD